MSLDNGKNVKMSANVLMIISDHFSLNVFKITIKTAYIVDNQACANVEYFLVTTKLSCNCIEFNKKWCVRVC